tara:strand:- start:217 stop:1245 length:1029 start_codon:yes stop_codon:yes gene_type:complete
MTAVLNSTFISQYWDANDCEPSKWCYTPSTYGVEGVELVGEKKVKAWEDFNSWVNPGRADGVDFGKVDALVEDIKENGINRDSQVIYYDVETKELINGDHRKHASLALSIFGWMVQGVRFDNDQAKVRFALMSNKRKTDVFNPVSYKDIEAAVRELMDLGPMTDDEIKAECREMGRNSISKPRWEELHNKLIAERRLKGTADGAERLYEWNQTAFEKFIEMSEDDWVKNYWDNDSEITMYLNENNWQKVTYTLIKKASDAKRIDKPLHLVIAVKLRSNESLNTSREKMFSDRIKSIERMLCQLFMNDPEYYGKTMPWNHPNCQHRFLPQDSKEGATKLISLN